MKRHAVTAILSCSLLCAGGVVLAITPVQADEIDYPLQVLSVEAGSNGALSVIWQFEIPETLSGSETIVGSLPEEVPSPPTAVPIQINHESELFASCAVATDRAVICKVDESMKGKPGVLGTLRYEHKEISDNAEQEISYRGVLAVGKGGYRARNQNS